MRYDERLGRHVFEDNELVFAHYKKYNPDSLWPAKYVSFTDWWNRPIKYRVKFLGIFGEHVVASTDVHPYNEESKAKFYKLKDNCNKNYVIASKCIERCEERRDPNSTKHIYVPTVADICEDYGLNDFKLTYNEYYFKTIKSSYSFADKFMYIGESYNRYNKPKYQIRELLEAKYPEFLQAKAQNDEAKKSEQESKKSDECQNEVETKSVDKKHAIETSSEDDSSDSSINEPKKPAENRIRYQSSSSSTSSSDSDSNLPVKLNPRSNLRNSRLNSSSSDDSSEEDQGKKSESDNLKVAVSSLKTSVHEINEENKSLKNELKTLKKSHEDLKKSQEDLKNFVMSKNQKEKEHENAENENPNIAEVVGNAEEPNVTNEFAFDRPSKKIKLEKVEDHVEQLDKLNQIITDLKNENSKLSEENGAMKNLEKENQKLKQEIEKMQRENETLKKAKRSIKEMWEKFEKTVNDSNSD